MHKMVTYIGKQIRIDKGFTVRNLAAASNIAPSSISKWENGSFTPDLTTLERVAVALNVHPFELVTFSMEKEACSKDVTKTKQQIKEERKGETRRMNNGEYATIAVYRSAKDIDVQFNDGTIATKQQYANFVKGSITLKYNGTKRRKTL